MTVKTFEVPDPPAGDPIEFEVGGRKFECLPRIPIGTRMLMRLGTITLGDTVPFVRGCLIPDHRGQWDDVVVDPKVMLDAQTVEDIFWYLIETYAEREDTAPLVQRKPE